ncbi:MAG TPA: ATP-binding cassette domain-containing protein [Terriglobales bacterium]|nr:ATP-binding cassette domain-containing protein [Terriglobales bacterium]
MATVVLDRVRKAFDRFVAVDDLAFSIAPGTIHGLLGPNGAGKTTTLRMILGILVPDSGEVRLFDEPFRREHLRRIGYLPEERGLYKRMKVLDQLRFLGEVKGLAGEEAARRARQWCERLAIADWLPRKVEELSKGMQQKVQFVAALLHDPEFVILDEPFAGMDPVNTAMLKDVLVELKNAGRTILFSTHRMEQIERLCDTICLLHRGRAVLQGDLKRIKAGYGRNMVHVSYEGAAAFLTGNGVVESFNDYGNYAEVRLKAGADAHEFLKLVAASCRVSRFELVEPSLEQIFLEVVGKADA